MLTLAVISPTAVCFYLFEPQSCLQAPMVGPLLSVGSWLQPSS
jgi:hypothetical protein